MTARLHIEEALGPNHPWTNDCLLTCAATLHALGRVEEATELRAKYGLKGEGR